VNTLPDQQLLRDYADGRSEPAFAELVRRHVDLVYSAALRMVRDSHLAEDVTQGVFLALAQNARQLAGRPVLSGWLHRTAQNLAANVVRTDVRRRAREQEAAAMNELLAGESGTVWEHLAPHLDAVLGELSDADRDALLLRYFERKSAREIAQTLGTTEDAAQKRVSRAVERLREFFAKRGVTVGAGGLTILIITNAVQAAPAGLAAAISATVFAGTTVTAATATATKVIAMTTLQKALVATAVTVLAGAGIYEAQQASTLRGRVQSLQQQQAPLAGEIERLGRERGDMANRLASLADEMERLKVGSTELLKLRGEVTRLRQAEQELAQLKTTDAGKTHDPVESATKDLLAQVNMLKQRLDQRPQTKIPELQYLNGQDWLRLVQNARLRADNPGEEQVLWALSTVRSDAKQQFAYRLGPALRDYAQANGGQLPADVGLLKPYFDPPADDAILARYQMLNTGNVNDLQPGDMVVAEKAPVDDQYDTLWQIGLTNFQWHGTGKDNRAFGKGSWPANISRPGTPAGR
jgi:RNA polymerase sigma factor (sigma-70 family)